MNLLPIIPRAEMLEHWRTRSDAASYLWRTWRSEALEELMADVPHKARILDLGCGAGRNLAHLAAAGYSRLEGLDINPDAVVLMRETYPKLKRVPVHVGLAENELALLDGPYDLIFTMSVLTCIHPASEVVFDQMARLGKSVLVIETDTLSTHMYARHDYVSLFEARGMRLRSRTAMSDFPGLAEDSLALDGYEAFRFDAA